MSDDQRDAETRYLRAREVLRDAGWCFDEFVNTEMRRILTSEPEDAAGREAAYMRARVATEIKMLLVGEVESFEGDLLVKERLGRSSERRTQ